VTAQRMRYAALGCGLLSIALALAGIRIVFPSFESVSPMIGSLIGIGTGLAFYMAFALPRWLRRSWQFEEIRQFLLGPPGRATQSPLDEATIFDALSSAAVRAVGGFAAGVARQDGADGPWKIYHATDATAGEAL